MTPVALWLTVVASGLYHGLNPAMGWPLAVSAGLMGRRRRDLFVALGSGRLELIERSRARVPA